MPKVNPNFQRLQREIIFPIIEKKMEALKHIDIVNLGIGDVALPLAPDIAKAIQGAIDEMTQKPVGYGPAAGYPFLREALAKKHQTLPDEIFISDGINSDLAGFQELFAFDCPIAALDPGYPVFGDTNLMAGRKVSFLPCVEEYGFIPQPPTFPVGLIYLCSPHNPTGVAMTKSDLTKWITYAKDCNATILFDAAYNAFITSDDVPHSIYEIEGAKDVAIELHSFSKSHGFTGLRCAYAIVPQETGLTELWQKRQNTKYNGCPYAIQVGAMQALKSKEAKRQVLSYLDCAKTLKSALGPTVCGGIDSPYLWWKVPDNRSSWEFFDELLNEHHILGIPGSGFGQFGEGYIRLSGFTTKTHVEKALDRLNAYAY